MEHYKHEVRSIDELIPYVGNSRTHSDEQILQVAASMKEFGFTSPVLIDSEGVLVAGHGRVAAAKRIGLKTAPCIVLEGLSEAQRKAYVIIDNQLALNAGWDMDLLKVEIEGLEALDFDTGLLGFDFSSLLNLEDDLFDGGDDDDYDDEDDLPSEPKKTDEGFAEFAVVMQVENKQRLTKLLNEVKADHGITSNEEALMILVE